MRVSDEKLKALIRCLMESVVMPHFLEIRGVLLDLQDARRELEKVSVENAILKNKIEEWKENHECNQDFKHQLVAENKKLREKLEITKYALNLTEQGLWETDGDKTWITRIAKAILKFELTRRGEKA